MTTLTLRPSCTGSTSSFLSFESLSCYRGDVKRAFETEARKLQIPRTRRTVIHPLRSNSHDPSLATGLKDGVFELYKDQLGLSKDGWQPRLMMVGGDGGTFEGLVRIQKYLQIMPSAYDRMDWMIPILQLWHTKWTAISRIIFNCWGEGSERSEDISCLGHNANLIGRKTPPNLKKVDFSRDSETLFIIGEARMRDCWREIFDVEDLDAHLTALKAANNLPSFVELRRLAKRLHYTYSCERAYQQALDPRSQHNVDCSAPLGRNWTAQNHAGFTASAAAGVTGHVEDRGFSGDRQLANSIRLMKQFVEKREWFRSTSVGDIGSTWECVKNEIPECAGSGHNPNYLNYLLMTYCIMEIYASLSLREGLMNNWLVKLTDEENKFKEGDLMQEHEINQLDRHLQHKDRQYDEPFIRNVISPNLDLLVEIPRQMEEAVGLQARKTYHLSPHTRAETAILAEAFRKAQLHRFCEGRSAGYAHKNSTDIGIRRLQDGGDALAKFREFHGDLDVLNSHSKREPLASETIPASAQPPDEQIAEAEGARIDGLLDELINDGSDEILPARVDDRTAVCLSGGQLAVERSEPSTAAALDRELLDDDESDKDMIRSDVDSESEDDETN
ncbi:hypothetical protein EXIGLDRAFT_751045 [Exidia glandulosa HHB12029]|uniref:DUF6589 domain-containing protein n=1 Tax=Exidia glandulosa HHB12029 TaxID=1314781 RepID=A0A165FWN3_EXIGL|nr:hypothetical protein EXIGLDRAFT_751045 [Exidia glandulosa HHB12029]